jgi:hypothetical protein
MAEAGLVLAAKVQLGSTDPVQGRTLSTSRIGGSQSLLKVGAVGAGGVEPPSSSVSANTGDRCARSRSPRSAPTVDAEGKRSLDVKGNALFQHLLTNHDITI